MRSPSRFGSRLTRCLRSRASGAGSQRASRFARRVSGSARRAARSRGRVGLVRELREEHLVGAGVALGQEPGAATRAVEPPLTLHSRNVLAEVVVRVELALRGRGRRAGISLPAKSEVGHLARAAVGTGEDVGHVRALEDGGQLKQIGTKPQHGGVAGVTRLRTGLGLAAPRGIRGELRDGGPWWSGSASSRKAVGMGFRLRRAACILGALGLAASAPAAFGDEDRRGERGDRGDRHGGDHGTVRFATFNASLNRYRAGQLVEELADPSLRPPGDRQIRTVAEIVQRVRPDVLLVNEFDFDDQGRRGTSRAAELFQDNYLSESQNGARPIGYRYRFTAPSNTGIASGFDLDNNGQVVTTPGTPGYGNDAYGFGDFPGQFGMTVYSRFPIVRRDVRTFQNFLWKDMPGARLPDDPQTPQRRDWDSPAGLAVFRLSSKSHWDVPIRVRGNVVHFLTSHPTPPVFDGPEDRNGTRNADEIRLWADYVTPGAGEYIYDDRGRRGGLKPGERFVIAGDQNSDPLDGDSIPGAIQQLLDNPRVNTTVTPSSPGGPEQSAIQGRANTTHRSDPAFDTADFNDAAPGNLRADYVLPDSSQRIENAFVFWPRSDDPLFPLVGTFNTSFFPDGNGFPSSDHRLVAVDVKAARAGGDHDDDDDRDDDDRDDDDEDDDEDEDED